jgi:hypothetical protein
MTKQKIAIIILFATVSSLAISSLFYLNHIISNVNCIANIDIINGNTKFKILLGRKMSGGKGVDTVIGRYYQNNIPISRVERNIRYHYSQDQGRYTMHTDEILKGPKDTMTDQALTENLPSLYFKKDGASSIVMKLIGNAGWLVYNTPIPVYYCRRVE